MKICIFYTSPKLGDIILQLPFIKAISDNYKTKVTICINKNINIKKILEDQSYIDMVIENPFRRGKFFILDIMHLTKELNNKNFSSAFILEKTKGPAIACRLANISNIYGFGIGSQKYLVDKSFALTKGDLKYNYTEQSLKFLKKFNIEINFEENFLSLDRKDKNNFENK